MFYSNRKLFIKFIAIMNGPFNNFAKLDSKASRLGLIFDWNWQFLNFKAGYLKMTKKMISC